MHNGHRLGAVVHAELRNGAQEELLYPPLAVAGHHQAYHAQLLRLLAQHVAHAVGVHLQRRRDSTDRRGLVAFIVADSLQSKDELACRRSMQGLLVGFVQGR
jgi:hypothetical protein